MFRPLCRLGLRARPAFPCASASLRAGLVRAPGQQRGATSLVGVPSAPACMRSVLVRTVPAASVLGKAAFTDLGLCPELLAALAEKSFPGPTEIQVAAAPAIINGTGDVLLASHTGSGKTLAYLLPLVHLLRAAEASGGAAARPHRPRAIVMGPTRELTDQILLVAKGLSHHARFRSACVNGGGDWGVQKRALERPVDLLVGTPQRLLQHAERGQLFYGDVELVVLDEADTMFDRGFGPEVRALLRALRSGPHPARAVLVAATLTKAVRALLDEEFPGAAAVETSSLHRGVAGARHGFLPLPTGADRLELLGQVVEGEARRGKRLMVFANTVSSCRAVEHSLSERLGAGATACYHGDVPREERAAALAAFGSDAPPLLICTDLAARGLDVPGRVDHVVNFDFPLNPVDYLHRTGRTARAGATGRVTSIVGKGDRVLAERVEEALARGLPLDALSADREDLPPHMRPKPETLRSKSVALKAEQHSRRGQRGAARQDQAAGRAAGPSAAGGLRREGSAGRSAGPSKLGGGGGAGRPAGTPKFGGSGGGWSSAGAPKSGGAGGGRKPAIGKRPSKFK